MIDSNWDRFGILGIVFFYQICGLITYDSVGVLQTAICKELNLTSTQFSYLYSIYLLPNTVLPLIYGYILDDRIIGLRYGTRLFIICILIGTQLIAVASYSLRDMRYIILLLGRLIYGIGAEGIYVAVNLIIIKWFYNYELGLALALSASAANLGLFLSLNVNSLCALVFGTYKASLWFAVLLSLICLGLNLILFKIGK